MGINPDIKLAEARERTFAQSIKIARGTFYPTLSLSGGFGSTYNNRFKKFLNNTAVDYQFFDQIRDNFNQSVALSLNIPIFNRFNAHTNVKKAELNFQNAQLNTQLAKNNLSKIIIQAVLDLNAADKQFQSATQTFEANRDALNVTQQRYDVGLVNSLDYNTAVTNYNRSQNDMIQAQYSVIFRSKIIDYYLGNTITL